VTYVAETWTVTSKIEKMLMTWERKMRKIYGPTKENGQWRIKTNAEFLYISLTVHHDINQFVITNLMHICFIS
jgi:hypothetical protein